MRIPEEARLTPLEEMKALDFHFRTGRERDVALMDAATRKALEWEVRRIATTSMGYSPGPLFAAGFNAAVDHLRSSLDAMLKEGKP